MFNPEPTQTSLKDDRNRRVGHGHDPKKRENYLEDMERLQKKIDKFEQKKGNLEQRIQEFPSDDEKLSKEQLHQKKLLQRELDHNSKLETKIKQGLGALEVRVANTNIKQMQNQIKHGKHKNMDGFGTKIPKINDVMA